MSTVRLDKAEWSRFCSAHRLGTESRMKEGLKIRCTSEESVRT